MNDKVTQVKQYVVYLPLNQHTFLKIYAAKKKITIASIFQGLVDNFVKENK